MNIVLIGFMGCGKSTAGKMIAQQLKMSFCDLDQLIEARAGKTIAGIFEQEGEQFFRELEQSTLREVLRGDQQVISSGGGTACHADNMKLMNTRAITVYLSLKPEKIFLRLRNHTQNRPLLRGKSDEELLKFITDTLEKREPYYSQASVILDADCPNPYDLAQRIITHLPSSGRSG
ncbi:MAG: shikimate kinase [Bacteroidales bacterium]